MSKNVNASISTENIKCLNDNETQAWMEKLIYKAAFDRAKMKNDFINSVIKRERKPSWWNFYNLFQKPLIIEDRGNILRVKRGNKVLRECAI